MRRSEVNSSVAVARALPRLNWRRPRQIVPAQFVMRMKKQRPKSINEALRRAASKLKKVWSVLHDSPAIRFKVTLKLYQRDAEEPNTLSMEVERGSKGVTEIKLLRCHDLLQLQIPETIMHSLAAIQENVGKYISENGLNEDWQKQQETIMEQINSDLSVDDFQYESDAPIRAVAAFGYDAHFYAPKIATMYAIKGAEAFKKGDLILASFCVARGLYWSKPEMFIADPKHRFTERASEGGHGKARRYEPVKTIVAKMILEMAPVGGWESTEVAIDEVAETLTSQHTKLVEDSLLVTHNLSSTIAGWIQAQPSHFPHPIKPKT